MVFHPSIKPPYFACIFSSTRPLLQGDDGYGETAERMVALAIRQDGYLGADSARDADGHGITVSYWKSQAAMLDWKKESEHLEAQKMGRDKFYTDYHIHIAEIKRHYSKDSSLTEFIT